MSHPVTTIRSAHTTRALAGLPFILAALLFVPGVGRAEAASRYMVGIDISHWQGSIDWDRVGRTSIGFVFAKATEGQTYNDPMYRSYRAGAKSERIPFGAYHFAQPDRTYHDALKEADHYVKIAALRDGDLIPVLDLESTGGLTRSQLITWTKTWVKGVTARLGRKPMIYTMPTFWKDAMGDTTWFANNGYRLWIASWNRSSPRQPAADWGGRDWSFWQYSGCGSVSGIRGCVDLDRANGAKLTLVTL
jgi:GH25 family lysozyme M1 (1,4-beta-N-acetylmuramidase)